MYKRNDLLLDNILHLVAKVEEVTDDLYKLRYSAHREVVGGVAELAEFTKDYVEDNPTFTLIPSPAEHLYEYLRENMPAKVHNPLQKYSDIPSWIKQYWMLEAGRPGYVVLYNYPGYPEEWKWVRRMNDVNIADLPQALFEGVTMRAPAQPKPRKKLTILNEGVILNQN